MKGLWSARYAPATCIIPTHNRGLLLMLIMLVERKTYPPDHFSYQTFALIWQATKKAISPVTICM